MSANIVHYLWAGFPVCGFHMGPPVGWPEGHTWVSPGHPAATCERCKEEHERRMLPNPKVLLGHRK